MATQGDVAGQIVTALAISDPDLDTSVGTTTRKIIDAVAESISEAYIDSHMLAYQYDIDSKVGPDLDTFVQNFGMTRYGAKRATGMVVFSRPAPQAITTVFIPVNTHVGNTSASTTQTQTTSAAFIQVGQTSVTVPVVAVLGGPEGNVGAGLLTQIFTPLSEPLSVTNIMALEGGTAPESDSELRLRWKRTVFRSLAGTEQMYLGIALDDAQANQGVGCYAANVVGASSHHREQVQISGGVAVSSVSDALYAYPLSPSLGPDIDNGVLLVRDHDYTFDTTVTPPRIVMLVSTYTDLSGSHPVEGAIFDLDFEYTDTSSRNDPANGLNNRIDVYCAGRRPKEATQSMVFPDSRFTNVTTDVLYRGYFYRDDGSLPVTNNVFIPLAFGPIMILPTTLSVSATTYTYGTDYWLVHQDIPFGLTPQSLFGMEWRAASIPGGGPPTFSITYTYNEVPFKVQQAIDNWRLVGTDAKAHAAKEAFLRFNLAIMYDPGVDRTVVNDAVRTALAKFLSGLGFNGTVQVSDIINIAHNVPGVDNIRFLNGSDDSGYDPTAPNSSDIAIQKIINGSVVFTYCDRDGSNHSPLGRPVDIVFNDYEVPVFNDLGGGGSDLPAVRAQNTFGPG